MKRVLMVIPSLEQGGGQKFVMDLAFRLDKRRYQVKVLVLYKKSGSIFDQYASDNLLDVEYMNKSLGLDWGLFAKVRRAVKAFNPEIVHSNLDSMLYLLPVYKKNQIKLHTIHSMAEKEAFGLQRLVRFVAFRLLKVVPVAISNTVANSISQVYRMPRKTIPVVNNGVDCKRYALPKEVSDSIRFISVGTIYHVKNYSFLVDCFAEVCREYNNVHLTLVGDGELRQKIEEQVEGLGIGNHVTVTGTVSNVEDYLAKADIYVASSVYEGLPLSMLEAMAAGLPVISTNVGGIADIVTTGVNGELIEFGDKDNYIRAMKRLIQASDIRSHYSKNAKESAAAFDVSHMIEGYQSLYNDVY